MGPQLCWLTVNCNYGWETHIDCLQETESIYNTLSNNQHWCSYNHQVYLPADCNDLWPALSHPHRSGSSFPKCISSETHQVPKGPTFLFYCLLSRGKWLSKAPEPNCHLHVEETLCQQPQILAPLAEYHHSILQHYSTQLYRLDFFFARLWHRIYRRHSAATTLQSAWHARTHLRDQWKISCSPESWPTVKMSEMTTYNCKDTRTARGRRSHVSILDLSAT